MNDSLPPVRLHMNPRFDRAEPYGARQRDVMSRADRERALATIRAWSGYRPTPLIDLPGLARTCGLGRVRLKHEGKRFHLRSFKALGGAYAVQRLIAERGEAAKATLTVCCATDGNHGKAVAWGAQQAGIRCVIYLHAHVSQGREDAIAAFGAEIRRVDGTYDDSVRQAARDAETHGWTVISDTSWDGYATIPAWVMQGYTVMIAEIIDQLGGDKPSHLFVQGGVGGLPAAVVAPFWDDWGADRPLPVVVEPHAADCLYQSAVAGRLTEAEGNLDTVMACLSAGEASPLAWQVLDHGAAAFMSMEDRFAVDAMIALAAGTSGDPPLVVGESGSAGVAALMALTDRDGMRGQLGLDESANVLVIASEGATDPDIYRKVVGRTPEAVGERV
jgi:diaminopropionate ammonia-lyase